MDHILFGPMESRIEHLITTPSCNFSDGYYKDENYNTSNNYNHKNGFRLLVVSVLSVLLFVVASITYIKNKKIAIILAISGFILLIMVIVYIVYDPFNLVHLISYIISTNVRTPPYLDKSFFPLSEKFEAEVETFKKEMENVMKFQENISFAKDTFGGGRLSFVGSDIKDNKGWRIFTVKAGNNINDDARKLSPKLVNLVEHEPSIRSCAYSILDPKTEIPIHIGYYKGFVRYQLPLKVPKNPKEAFICVNGEKYYWEEGKGVLFDDTYPHKVYNTSDEIRIVIYMDIERKIENHFLSTLNNKALNIGMESPVLQREAKKEIARTEKNKKLT